MYLYRSSKPGIVPLVPAPEEGAYHFVRAKGRPECPQLRIVRINGSVYFGAASYVQQALQQIDEDNPQQKVGADRSRPASIPSTSPAPRSWRRKRGGGGGSAAACISTA
jgi:SulP family sulfate permease